MAKNISNSKVKLVEARTLRVHPRAQREVVPSKKKRLIAELDLDAIGVLHGVECEIDGEYAIWIIDGQHRLLALLHHGLGEWKVEVKIHLDAHDDARASALFLKLNDRAPVSPFDKFKNRLEAGDPVAVGVDEIVTRLGLRVERHTSDGAVRCPSSLTRVYVADDGAALSSTLSTLTAAFGHASEATEGKIIEGVGFVFARYNGEVDGAVLVKKLAKYPGKAPGLLGDARGLKAHRSRSLAHCVAEVVIEAYNKGRRSGQLAPL